ncbi:MAG: aminopeptidase [Spirochaetales bacterium]|nr:aminopeptidase [Spirochaetales bacterium]
MKKIAIALVIFGMVTLLSQCYYIREGAVLLDIYASGEDIDRALAGQDLSPSERTLLLKVREIKRFAVTRFGLADNANYTSYIRINRKYLAAVVSACDRLSFRQYVWDYLFVGRLPYQGFFDADEAEREARLLKEEGQDVYVRPVDAFSTLGLLSDPVFSFMQHYPDYALAELITHEQTHATVFITGQATFNENLANFVGKEGMREYIKEKFGEESDEYRTALSLDHDARAFATTVRVLYERLNAAYGHKTPDEEKLKQKADIIDSWKKEFAERYEERFKTALYRRFPKVNVNNAVIMTNMNYTEQSGDFASLFALCHNNLALFVSYAKRIARDSKHPLDDLRAFIESGQRDKIQ